MRPARYDNSIVEIMQRPMGLWIWFSAAEALVVQGVAMTDPMAELIP